jgi:dipeptidyl aminopeptidase/acylaminoacyl peptidase
MARRPKRYSIEQLMHCTRMSGISFSHDEREILVTSNSNGIPNAHTISAGGGTPRQLTFSTEEPINALSYFPRDNRILYIRDKGGIENRHLCVLEEDGREIYLTEGPRVKTGFYGWTVDGRHLYCTSDERARNHFDVYRIDAGTYERSLIFRDDDSYLLGIVSPDEQYLTFIKYEGFSDSNLYLYHTESHTLELITPHTGEYYYVPLYFGRNSHHLYYRASEKGESCVFHYDLKTQHHERMEGWPCDFRHIFISESRRYRALVVDEREGAKLNLYDYSASSPVTLKNLPVGNVVSVVISKSDRLVGFYLNGDRQPNELYVYDLLSHRLCKLTENINPEINLEDLVESEITSFKSFDGLEIPCLLWKPHEANASSKAPGLIWVHGGPIGQTRKGYAGAVQYLVNHGYVVFAVNHRGSTGYGQVFMNAADGKQGREPLWDCIEAKRYLAALDYVDSTRIGIIGGSFGGYMALAALTFHPKEFSVGVAISGISNLVRHVAAKIGEPQLREMYLKTIGDPVVDREKLEAISPVFHAKNIVRPLMVMHGAKDPRTAIAEAEDIVSAVRAHGGVVEYLQFEDEAHGFRKRENSIRAYRAVLNFLDRYLKSSVFSLAPENRLEGRMVLRPEGRIQ